MPLAVSRRLFRAFASTELTALALADIQTAAWATTGSDGYGYNIHGGLSGSMHDHILTFK